MICSKCKTEFDNGLLYCPKCGHAVQIVPDYNLLDEDILPSMLVGKKTESKEEPKKSAIFEENKTDADEKKSVKSGGFELTLIQKRICFGGGAIVLILLVIGIFHLINEYNYNTLVERGESYIEKESYEQALNVLRNAYSERGEMDVLFLIAKAEAYSGDTKSAIRDLKILIDYDGENVSYYETLLPIYLEQGDTEAIDSLRENVTSKNLLDLFEDYVTETVTYSLEQTEYSDNQVLELSSDSGYDIFYTLDGNSPTDGNGMRYQGPIELSEGTTFVSAVVVSESGTYGPVTNKKYVIKYVKPNPPTVTPSAGNYSGDALITVVCDEYLEVFYTWDGTTPNRSSNQYILPITMEEGNHIFSVVTYDRNHDLYSNVVRVNYIYQ